MKRIVPKTFLLRKPWTSEKATEMNTEGKYVFLVDPNATKPEIRKAIGNHYRVQVDRVHVINAEGKPMRYRSIQRGGKEFKKAIVTLKPGHKIDHGR